MYFCTAIDKDLDSCLLLVPPPATPEKDYQEEGKPIADFWTPLRKYVQRRLQESPSTSRNCFNALTLVMIDLILPLPVKALVQL